MYEQSLVKIIEPIKRTTISRLNKGKKWKYKKMKSWPAGPESKKVPALC